MAITLIGTSHISRESIQQIRKTVEAVSPDIIAVELDRRRLLAVLEKRSRKVSLADIRHIGLKGYLFALIGGYVQEKLGKMVGVKPGAEMREAVQLAKERKIQLALIDQPIEVTLRRFSQALTWKEKFRMAGDVFRGIFQPQKQLHDFGLDQFDLRKVPAEKVIEKMMTQLKLRYPNIHRVLVEERNIYMVKKLQELQQKYPEKNIVAVVGAGHKKEMEEMLKKTLLTS